MIPLLVICAQVPSDSALFGPWFWEDAEDCMDASHPTGQIFLAQVEPYDCLATLDVFTPSSRCGNCGNGRCTGVSGATCGCLMGFVEEEGICIDRDECADSDYTGTTWGCPTGMSFGSFIIAKPKLLPLIWK